jgi:hypothetical protein
MSESVLTAPAPPQGGDHEAPGKRGPDRRVLLFGVLAAVVIVAVAAYFLVLHKSSPSPATATNPVAGAPAVHPMAAPAPSAQATIPATYNDAVGRDPFAPLYTPPAASPSAAPSPSAGTGTTTGTANGTGTAATGPAATGTGSAAAATPSWIELESEQGVRYASFLVGYSNGTVIGYPNVMAPPAGSQTIFGQDFALDGLGVGVAELQEGDTAPFQLKAGAANKHSFG